MIQWAHATDGDVAGVVWVQDPQFRNSHPTLVDAVHELRTDARPCQAGSPLRRTGRFRDKALLQRHGRIVEPGELPDAHHPAAAVGQAANVDDHVDGAADLLSDGAYR